jgi:hypothetical protein
LFVFWTLLLGEDEVGGLGFLGRRGMAHWRMEIGRLREIED